MEDAEGSGVALQVEEEQGGCQGAVGGVSRRSQPRLCSLEPGESFQLTALVWDTPTSWKRNSYRKTKCVKF